MAATSGPTVRCRPRTLAALLLQRLPCAAAAWADARLAGIFGDPMVPRRDAPIAVWSWADAGDAVRVQLAIGWPGWRRDSRLAGRWPPGARC